jgi:DNA-binding response OmpR family regulator
MSGKKILIVDDDEEICLELKDILEDEGYKVSYELDGLKGFDNILKNNYHLIIQDLKLPGMDGIELLKRTKVNNKNQKVVVLTGRPLNSALLNENSDYKNEENDLNSNADRIFNKPFNIMEILNNIKELIEGHS